MTPRQRDIVLVPVPFSDLTSIRRRPVLVLSNDGHNRRADDVVVAAITSQLTRGGYSVRITAADLEEGVLRRDSLVRADKIYTLHQSMIAKRFGRLKQNAFCRVLAQIDALWGK